MKYIIVKKFCLFAVTLAISANCLWAQQAGLLPGNIPGNAENINNPMGNNNAGALQFKAHGRILRFDAKGMMAASAMEALRIEFVGANPVTPAGEGTPATMATAKPSEMDGKPAAPETLELKEVNYSNLWPGVNLNISGFVLTYTLTNLNRSI